MQFFSYVYALVFILGLSIYSNTCMYVFAYVRLFNIKKTIALLVSSCNFIAKLRISVTLFNIKNNGTVSAILQLYA